VTVDEPVADILARLQGLSAEQVLADVATRYAGRVAFYTALGAEDQVVTHMIAEGGLRVPIFTVDTGRLLPETHDLIEQTSARYDLSIAVYSPNSADVEIMVKRDGINLFRKGAFERFLCCEARKACSGVPPCATTRPRTRATQRPAYGE
jgi:phosphoadenosine phosphosulfate reductase